MNKKQIDDFTQLIPENWSLAHEEEIQGLTAVYIQEAFSKLAKEIKWKCLVKTEFEVMAMLKEISPRYGLTPENIINETLENSKISAIVVILKKYYGNLFPRDESGEIILPVDSLSNIFGMAHSEIEKGVKEMEKDCPERFISNCPPSDYKIH